MIQNYCAYCMNPSNEDLCATCGKDKTEYQTAIHHLPPGTILNGKYLIGAVLGEGGFGITYIGRDIKLDYRVAIKEYYPSGIVGRYNTYSSDITVSVGDKKEAYEKGKRRFLEEARTLAKFAMEPSIVSVHDFFEENNTAYIAMDYLEGMDLREYIEKNGKMTFAQTFTMLSPIMTALGKIHAMGLIHRDISPSNIMIMDDGSAKLLDFGATRDVNNGEKSLSIMLKPGYAPEEQYRTRGNQGPWTDVYALSATMYKMMTGETPDDSMNRLYLDEVKKITEFNSTVTPKQGMVILQGMAVRQADRFQTIGALQAACASCLQEREVHVEANVKVEADVSEEKTYEKTTEDNIEKTVGFFDEMPNELPKENKKTKKVKEKKNKKVKRVREKKNNMACLIGAIVSGICSLSGIGMMVEFWITSNAEAEEIEYWTDGLMSYDWGPVYTTLAGYFLVTVLFVFLAIFLWKKRKTSSKEKE